MFISKTVLSDHSQNKCSAPHQNCLNEAVLLRSTTYVFMNNLHYLSNKHLQNPTHTLCETLHIPSYLHGDFLSESVSLYGCLISV